MRCDQGRFVRYPRGFPLTDEEAAQLEAVAAFHTARPQPARWKAAGLVALQDSSARLIPPGDRRCPQV